MAIRQIRVVVVDDSALVRELLTRLLNSDPEIKVVDTAPDPLIAREKIKIHNPDVITLDVEMPRMDGLEFLDRLMRLRPMPVVMVSSLTQKGNDATLRALELGAVDFVSKPRFDLADGLSKLKSEICEKVKAAAQARVDRRQTQAASPPARLQGFKGYATTECIIAIGASTGGVEALTAVLHAMPADSPAIMVTQHMPEGFTKSFAARLDGMTATTVVEASEGIRVLPGHVYLAPGSRHLELVRSGANYVCRVKRTDRVSGHCPSVDVLFESVSIAAGANAVGVILTGMGKDGAEGMLRMRRAGARTFGQDEATCVVYGMPRAAFEIGAVEAQAPLGRIAENILKACSSDKGRVIRV
jgi:two-component system chemotaxis response regulator CheB